MISVFPSALTFPLLIAVTVPSSFTTKEMVSAKLSTPSAADFVKPSFISVLSFAIVLIWLLSDPISYTLIPASSPTNSRLSTSLSLNSTYTFSGFALPSLSTGQVVVPSALFHAFSASTVVVLGSKVTQLFFPFAMT